MGIEGVAETKGAAELVGRIAPVEGAPSHLGLQVVQPGPGDAEQALAGPREVVEVVHGEGAGPDLPLVADASLPLGAPRQEGGVEAGTEHAASPQVQVQEPAQGTAGLPVERMEIIAGGRRAGGDAEGHALGGHRQTECGREGDEKSKGIHGSSWGTGVRGVRARDRVR